MDSTEVTTNDFKNVMGYYIAYYSLNFYPVEYITWYDAILYCNKRSNLYGMDTCYTYTSKSISGQRCNNLDNLSCDFTKKGYRLPTEAEWEYACRAGMEGAYDFGAADKLRQNAWFADNADEKTHPVGQKKPNRWGLHDMYGNVAEWCEDVYSTNYYQASAPVDPTGPPSEGKDTKRVMRGGSWKASADMCRATFRQGQRTGDTDACFYTDYCGFRCVRRASPEELDQLRSKTK